LRWLRNNKSISYVKCEDLTPIYKQKKSLVSHHLISHEYHKISKEELIKMVDLLKNAEKFVEKVKKMQK